MLKAATPMAGRASQAPGANEAPKTTQPMPSRTALVTAATTMPPIARPMTIVSGRVGVSQAGSSVPASISRLKPYAISQNAVPVSPPTIMPRKR